MGNNQLTGNIPSSFSSLTGLQWLCVSSNQLSGPLPDFLGSFTGLTYVLW